jgi:hypothetical protein
MNDHEQINDSALTRELRESLTGITAPQRPPLDTITARARAQQRHRLTGIAGLSAAGIAAGTALALGLTGVLGSAPARTGTIRTAAFTLVQHANGTATLTINPSVLLEPSTLQSDLQQDGIASMVNTGSFCSSDPIPAGFPQVVSQASGPTSSDVTVTINPAAMPAGTELSFGIFQYSASSTDTELELIDTSSYTCSSALPSVPPSGEGVLVIGRGNGIGEPAGT